MRPKINTRYVELNAGILELIYQRGYRYYLRIQSDHEVPEDTCLIYFEIRFYKTEVEAKVGFALISGSNVFTGHILDENVKEFARGIPFCKFLMRDRGY